MSHKGRNPREAEPAREGPLSDPMAPSPRPRDPNAAAEPPPADRWEDEGGKVKESPVDAASSAAAPAPAAKSAEPEPDYKDRWLRAEAELQNFRRRAARDAEETRRVVEESVLLEMVAALDDLERALASDDAQGAAGAWREGVTLVAQRLRDGLARRGVAVEDPLGRPFDPAFHEAMLEVEAPPGAAPGSVVQVIHKGYRRGDRALRAARVVVARADAGSVS